jgi:hypothetical protein
MGRFNFAAITGIFLLTGFSGTPSFGQQTSSPTVWSPANAAAYLDKRSAWWITWPTSARDHGTFCVSCHTATPFSLGRAALRGSLGESVASPNEQKVLDNVTKRVRMWHDVDPFYTDQARGLPKASESRGTEPSFEFVALHHSGAQLLGKVRVPGALLVQTWASSS